MLEVEGPMDAADCVTGGILHVVTICGAAYSFPDQFRGVGDVLLAFDAEDAGGRECLHRPVFHARCTCGVPVQPRLPRWEAVFRVVLGFFWSG
ncbi:MAG: hypothetical protein ACR2OU_00160 [Thermomicrobiales bacterium]